MLNRRYIDIEQIPEDLGGKKENFAWNFPENFNEHEQLAEVLKSTCDSVSSSASPNIGTEEVSNNSEEEL